MSVSGGCLCGACRFTASPEAEAGVCHCGICRKWTGGMNMAVGCKDVVWNADAPIKVYRSSDWAERAFCGTCGSNLYYRSLHAPASEVVISLMAFDEPAAYPITRQIFIDEKPDTYALANETMTMTGAEVMAMFAPKSEGNA